MSEQTIPWDEDALKRLGKIEKAAVAAGETKVTVEFMDANKAKLMG